MHEYLKKLLPLKRTAFEWQGLEGGIFKGGTTGAPALVLQHGLTGDHRGLIPLAHQLKDSFEIYLTELPGHGVSPLPHSNVSLEELAGWFAAAVKHITPEPTVLAHSFGCSIALRALALQPEVMARCVLINPVPHTAGHVKFYQWVGNKIPYAITNRLDATSIFREIKMKMMFERTEKAEALSELFLPRIGAFDAAHARLFMHLGGLVQRDDVYHDPRLVRRWPRVSAIIGPKDKLLSDKAKRVLQSLLAEDKIIAVPRTGHLTPIEAPEETAQMVIKMLGAKGAGAERRTKALG